MNKAKPTSAAINWNVYSRPQKDEAGWFYTVAKDGTETKHYHATEKECEDAWWAAFMEDAMKETEPRPRRAKTKSPKDSSR